MAARTTPAPGRSTDPQRRAAVVAAHSSTAGTGFAPPRLDSRTPRARVLHLLRARPTA